MKNPTVRAAARRVLMGAVLAICSCSVLAQSQVTPEDEYKKLIKVNEDVQPLGETPFGESVSLYNGSLSFEQTDISLPGTGPLISVSRSYHLREAKESESVDGAFSDWDIEIPKLTTVTANQMNVTGWQIDAPNADARCTLFRRPPTVAMQQGGADWDPGVWWTGYQMVMPGGGSQDLLKRTSANTLAPQMTGLDFPIVTKQNWMVGCLASTDGSAPGEGFFAYAPDGTKYVFNHLIYRWAPNMNRPIGSGPLSAQAVGFRPMVAVDDFLRRRQADMLVTRVEDRFGNYVTYNYDGANLTSITGSDGRTLSFTYEPGSARISTISMQASNGATRTWRYTYGTDVYHVLTKATLPDGSAWSFNLSSFLASDMDPAGGTCSTPATLSDTSWTGTITHPSGLQGSFQVKGMVHGRSYVPRSCVGTGFDTPGSYASLPRFYYQLTLLQKVFSGAGIPARTWAYNYSAPNYSWQTDCASGCPSTISTDVVNPDGSTVRSTFSNQFDATEGQLKRVDYYSGAVGSTLMRSEINTYATTDTGPWPTQYGGVLQSRMNRAVAESLAPLVQKELDQDGDAYFWNAEAFNEFAQVTKTKRSNSIAGQAGIEEQTSYLNDLPHWVLGLPLQTDNLSKGETVSKSEYESSYVTLSRRYRFGQPLMSYAFNAQGQLASFTDGKNNTTSLQNYKRGIPQLITYADSTTQNIAVDDFGQIASITDQAGNTTAYSYDGVGRLTGIAYPSGDEQSWLPKQLAYDFVNVTERGVGPNHWRRTVSKGNQRNVTYFDATLRPVLTDSYIANDPNSHITSEIDYDWKGQKLFSSYPSSGTPDAGSLTAGARNVYDALGRPTQVQQTSEQGALVSKTDYLSGARRQVTDPKGYVTVTAYQVFDQPAYDAVIQVQAPEGVTQTIVRDLYGNPLSITQPRTYGTETTSVIKTLTYDSFHRLCRTNEPESGDEVTSYDDANNILWTASGLRLMGSDCSLGEVADAAKTTRKYNVMNRVEKLIPPEDTQGTLYTYDNLGNVATATSGVSVWTANRNKLGQLTSETLQIAGQNPWSIQYEHDAYASLARLRYPTGEAVNYAPDALGRATQAGTYATGVSYYPDGDVASFTFGNGDSYAVQKNARLLLSNFTYGNGGTLKLSEDYAYDGNGNISSISDLTGGPRSKSFGYDTLNRLTSAHAAGLWGDESYGYDTVNNIRSRTGGGQSLVYNYDNNNLLANISSGGTPQLSFRYDGRGNVIDRNGTTLVFDQRNQLLQAQGFDTYAYDAAGRRVSKVANDGKTTLYFYTQAGQLLYQYEPATQKATDYIYLGKKMLARSELTLVVPDQPASINATASNAGSFTVSWSGSANAAYYLLEQSFNGGGWSQVYNDSGTAKSFSVTDAGAYSYRVAACNSAGCSAAQTGATVTVIFPPTVVPAISLPANSSTGSYTAAWNAVPVGSTYTLQERVNGGAWNTVQDSAATSAALTGRSDGSYGYQVRACNGGGCTGWSSVAVIAVALIPPTPNKPSISVSGPDWKPVFTLHWGAVQWATRYEAEQTTSSDVTTIYNGPDTTASILVLDEGAVSYRVRACNANGCSAWSDYTSHGGAAIPPPSGPPAITAPSSSNTGSYTVSWNAIGGATSYVLQEQINGGGWTTIQNSAATSIAIAGKGSANYGYQVQACNSSGCSGWSAVVTVTVGVIPATPARPSVSKSGGTTASPVIKVSWAAVPNATTYHVQAIYPGDVSGDTIYTGAATSFTQVIFATGTVKFLVQACNATGCSGWSVAGTITLQSG